MTLDPRTSRDPDRIPIDERVRDAQAELKAQARSLTRAATVFAPLSKPEAYADLKKLDQILGKVRKKVDTLPSPPRSASMILDAVEAWRRARKDELRERLGRELKAACTAAGLPLRVISREQPIEVRIPPLSVVIDIDRASAELRFARETVKTCPADPQEIVAAHGRAVEALDRPLDPAAYFDRCVSAWKAARVALGAPERVEILDFLPYLALGMQKSRFRTSPTRENFASYSRAQFAYDVLRLRRQHGFQRNGLRMNLGVATGTTASQKKRVIYLEDEDGNGEFKLTVFFTKEEVPA